MSIVNAAKFLMRQRPNTVRLFRGEEPNRTGIRLSRTGLYSPSLKNRFFFDNPADARWYAQRAGTLTGNVKSVDVPEKYVNIGKKMAKRREGPSYGSEVILPKKFIPEVELNYIQTVAARLQATLDYLKGKRYG
tara:strand:+ start:24 stop:425 length:402 start_codon:yes stop_codon:yes gene_type:complete